MSKITIARCLVATVESQRETIVAKRVEDIRDAVSGFTLTDEAGAYVVSDGRDSFETADAAEALRTYAEYIETFVDDLDDPETQTVWQAEVDRARADADALGAATRETTALDIMREFAHATAEIVAVGMQREDALLIESSVFCLGDATDENGDPWRGYVWTTGGVNESGYYEVDSDGYAETADEARTEIAEWVGRTARFYVLVTDHVEVESRIERRNLSREDAIAYARRFADDFAARRGAQVSEHHGGLEIGIETADGDELGYVEVIRHGSAYGAAGVLA